MIFSSFIKCTEKSSSTFNPIRLIMFRSANYRDDIVCWMARSGEGSSSFLRLIQWAFVMGVVDFIFWYLNRFEVDYWHLTIQNIRNRFFDERRFKIDWTSLRIKSIDQTTIWRGSLSKLFLCWLLENKWKSKWIDWHFKFTSVDLQNRSQKSLWKEECWYPI